MHKALIVLAVSTLLWGCAVEAETLRHFQTGAAIPYGGKQQAGTIEVATVYRPKAREFRGAWVATVENIDFGKHATAEEFKRDYIAVVNFLRQHNFNAVLFQIRPNNDAFYPSKLNPWSRWMTGTEGKGYANFDPLKFMVEEAHKRNLEFHAWLNPYRVTSSTPMRKQEYVNTLAPLNFARKRPDLVMEVPLEGAKYQLILNPAEPEVVSFVCNTVQEIISNYDVDAIHFDDYFYPYTDIKQIDAAQFKRYNPRNLALADWRRSNVDNLIYRLSRVIDTHNKSFSRKVQLGISPFGIWDNKKSNPLGSLTAGSSSYSRQYADTRKWVKEEWIDYIVPQLYWQFNRDVAPYAALADWWAEQVKGTKVNLYIGMAAYRVGGDGDWKNADEIPAQMRFNAANPHIKGMIFFSYKSVAAPTNEIMKAGVQGAIRNYWNRSVSTPITIRNR